MLLVAGDKSGGGERRFYRALIHRADERFDRHSLIARFPDRPPVELSGIAGRDTGD